MESGVEYLVAAFAIALVLAMAAVGFLVWERKALLATLSHLNPEKKNHAV